MLGGSVWRGSRLEWWLRGSIGGLAGSVARVGEVDLGFESSGLIFVLTSSSSSSSFEFQIFGLMKVVVAGRAVEGEGGHSIWEVDDEGGGLVVVVLVVRKEDDVRAVREFRGWWRLSDWCWWLFSMGYGGSSSFEGCGCSEGLLVQVSRVVLVVQVSMVGRVLGGATDVRAGVWSRED